MATALVIVHGLVAVALLGAITHQTLATWAPAGARPGSFFGRFRAVQPASFADPPSRLILSQTSAGKHSAAASLQVRNGLKADLANKVKR